MKNRLPKALCESQKLFCKAGFHEKPGEYHKRKHGGQKGVEPEHETGSGTCYGSFWKEKKIK